VLGANSFENRIHHAGFKINNIIYSYGGLTEKGIILDEFV
jgi:hypothetical protein